MRNTDWFYEKGFGVFVHYLDRMINDKNHPRSLGKQTSWDECLKDFDCDLFAKQVHEIGAGYVFFTVMQVTKYMLAPNDTFNQISGYKNGEACPSFDFIENLYQALKKYDIDLMLYFTGDGPANDEQAGNAFGYRGYNPGCVQVKKEFVEKWALVLREYSLKYGDKIKGWWLDGCFKLIGYNVELLKIMTDAARAGNEEAICGCNYFGVLDEYGCPIDHVRMGTPFCDFTAGEMVYLQDIPTGPYVSGQGRWHILTHLGKSMDQYEYNGWGCPGCRYDGEYLNNYYKKVHEHGGVITLDVCVYRDGSIDKEQMEAIKQIKSSHIG